MLASLVGSVKAPPPRSLWFKRRSKRRPTTCSDPQVLDESNLCWISGDSFLAVVKVLGFREKLTVNHQGRLGRGACVFVIDEDDSEVG